MKLKYLSSAQQINELCSVCAREYYSAMKRKNYLCIQEQEWLPEAYAKPKKSDINRYCRIDLYEIYTKQSDDRKQISDTRDGEGTGYKAAYRGDGNVPHDDCDGCTLYVLMKAH